MVTGQQPLRGTQVPNDQMHIKAPHGFFCWGGGGRTVIRFPWNPHASHNSPGHRPSSPTPAPPTPPTNGARPRLPCPPWPTASTFHPAPAWQRGTTTRSETSARISGTSSPFQFRACSRPSSSTAPSSASRLRHEALSWPQIVGENERLVDDIARIAIDLIHYTHPLPSAAVGCPFQGFSGVGENVGKHAQNGSNNNNTRLHTPRR